MFYKIIMYVIATIILSGCATMVSKVSKRDIESVQHGDKALVIMPCDTFIHFSFLGLGRNIRTDMSCYTSWQKGTSEKYFKQALRKGTYIVDPGIYHLRSIDAILGDNHSAMHIYSHNIHNAAQFEVQGGEVLYVGNIMWDIHKSGTFLPVFSTALSINDRYDEVRQLMKKENPDLLNRLEKRLIDQYNINGTYIVPSQ